MCMGVAIFADNKEALYAKKTNSHTEGEKELRIDGDKYRKFEYLWWEKKLQQAHYDRVAENILEDINIDKSTFLVRELIKDKFNTQAKLAKWLKNVPDEWDKLLEPKFKSLAKKTNPTLLIYQDKIAKFKKTPIEKYNPYQATKCPSIKDIKRFPSLGQVGDQVRGQVGAASYWGIKVALNLNIKHWFFDFLKLGIIIVFVEGKVKIFGKKGIYLGEYDEKDLK